MPGPGGLWGALDGLVRVIPALDALDLGVEHDVRQHPHHLFGAQAAARYYYRVDAAQLNAAQAARLAVMLPAP